MARLGHFWTLKNPRSCCLHLFGVNFQVFLCFMFSICKSTSPSQRRRRALLFTRYILLLAHRAQEAYLSSPGPLFSRDIGPRMDFGREKGDQREDRALTRAPGITNPRDMGIRGFVLIAGKSGTRNMNALKPERFMKLRTPSRGILWN